jgi:hypothetical protein
MKKETLEERVADLEQQLEAHKKICVSQRRWLILGVLISTISLIMRLSEQKEKKEGPLIEYINELIIEKDEIKTNPNPTNRPSSSILPVDSKP